jgi:ubiquinone/menaquinone biosynthesis C-methylase UbiE
MTERLPTLYGDSLVSEIYDLQSAAIAPSTPSAGDTAFFRRLADELGGPVLEIGSGTGRISIPLAEAGFEVVGVDSSKAMLRLAEAKRAALAPEAAGRLTFVHGDMTTLQLDRRFPLIVAPSRVFQFALTSDAQRAALRAFKRHLAPGGRLVLDIFDPAFEYVGPDAVFPPRAGEVVHPTTGNRVLWEITGREPDPGRQLVHSDWTAREISPSGDVLRKETERLTLRWTTRSEMRLLFELEGLDVVSEHVDFQGGAPTYGGEQVWVLSLGGGSAQEGWSSYG